jgi:hypothetical protein
VAKIHLQAMLSDVGYSNFKRPAVFCAETEKEKTEHYAGGC